MMALSSSDKEYLLNSIRDVEDFPKPGIVFKDITTLLNNKKAFNILLNHLEDRYKDVKLDYIAGIDSRGFILGAPLADRLNIGFVPIRKKGKLPSESICEKYELEYGFDEVELHIDAFNGDNKAKVLIIDDLCATGGTAEASSKLVTKLTSNLIEVCFLINLISLNGSSKIKKIAPIYNILEI
jgi:adenine phosphoribosyltransferase